MRTKRDSDEELALSIERRPLMIISEGWANFFLQECLLLEGEEFW